MLEISLGLMFDIYVVVYLLSILLVFSFNFVESSISAISCQLGVTGLIADC